MSEIGNKIVGAAVGFLIGCLILVVLYFSIQFIIDVFDMRSVRFRAPIVIFILPIITAIFGFQMGPEIIDFVQRMVGDSGPWTRLLLIGPVFWGFIVLAYAIVFEPFGSRISENEWILIAKIVLFPTGVLWLGVFIVTKFVLKREK